MTNGRAQTVEKILMLETAVYRATRSITLAEWLQSELTMPQFKILILLYTDGPMRMSALAVNLGVSLATATGVVDRLVERCLVVREGLPDDRRVVLCRLSEKGFAAVSRLREESQARMRQVLATLSEEQLAVVAQAMEIMHSAAGQLGLHNLPACEAQQESSLSRVQPHRPVAIPR